MSFLSVAVTIAILSIHPLGSLKRREEAVVTGILFGETYLSGWRTRSHIRDQ